VHGTAIAGVIGSAANNREGIVGVAPDVRIEALRACWPIGPNSAASRCTSFTLAQALEMAIRLEPRIINLSLAGPDDPLLARLLDEAIAHGIIVVAAEPVSPSADNAFPSSHPGVVAAGSTEPGNVRAGGYVLAAPASEVLTTTPGSGYAFLSGNSLAAAHVSGVIALLLEADPSLGAGEAVAVLSATSVSLEGRRSINACRALEQLEDRRSGGVSRPAGTGTLTCESPSTNAARLLVHPAASPVTASSR
jgi:subtilisin family serine protease